MNQQSHEDARVLQEFRSCISVGWNDNIVGTIILCGVVDLKSIAVLTAARSEAISVSVAIAEQEKLIASAEKAHGSENNRTSLLRDAKVWLGTIGDECAQAVSRGEIAIMRLKVLLSLLDLIDGAIRTARGYVNDSEGISFFFLPLIDRFAYPALMGRLSSEWPKDDFWAKTADVQVLQRMGLFSATASSELESALADLKSGTSQEQWRVLVSSVCENARCSAEDLREILARLREKAKEWPIEYRPR